MRAPTHLKRNMWPGRELFLWVNITRAAEGPQAFVLPTLSPSTKISLVTCSPGDELYAAFGHSAIRILDPELGFDRLYNFGTFDMSVDNFYLRFARGDLLYQLSVVQGDADINEHGAIGQGVTEAQLNLTPEQKCRVYSFCWKQTLPRRIGIIVTIFYSITAQLDCGTRLRKSSERLWPTIP